MGKIKQFLKFNGRNIYMLDVNGQYWVALKPICEAIGINWDRQRITLKEDTLLSQLLCEHTMVGADGRLRKMVALPEKYVYGWLFRINSNNPQLEEYQYKCYELLYNYFHGTIVRRISALREKSDSELEIEQLQAKLRASEEYQRIQSLKKDLKTHNQQLAELDEELTTRQLSIWN